MRRIPAFLVLLGSLQTGVIPARAQALTPKLEVAETRQDFGAVPPGPVVKKTFIIRNQGSAPLIIRRAEQDAQLSGRRGDQQPHTARAIDREDHPYSASSEQPPPPVTE